MRNSRIIASIIAILVLLLMLALAIAAPPGAHAATINTPAPERGRDCTRAKLKTTIFNDYYSSSTLSYTCEWRNLKGRLIKQRIVILTVSKTPDAVTTSKSISSVRYYRHKPPRHRSSLSVITVPVIPDVVTIQQAPV